MSRTKWPRPWDEVLVEGEEKTCRDLDRRLRRRRLPVPVEAGTWYPTCDDCGGSLWRGKCGRNRCPSNSEAYLRRRAKMIRENLSAFEGDVVMLTVTGPGKDFGEAWQWNGTAAGRWKCLRRAACQSANRHVKGQRSGLLFFGPEYQRRGLLHWHVALGATTVLERRWCEHFAAYCKRNAPRYGFGRQTHWGRRWQPAGEAVGAYVGKLARYVSKLGGVREGYERGEVSGRHWYVSSRLTRLTGVTMASMRLRSRWWRATGQWLRPSELRELVAFVAAGWVPLPLRT
jgi:hypothetical protein